MGLTSGLHCTTYNTVIVLPAIEDVPVPVLDISFPLQPIPAVHAADRSDGRRSTKLEAARTFAGLVVKVSSKLVAVIKDHGTCSVKRLNLNLKGINKATYELLNFSAAR